MSAVVVDTNVVLVANGQHDDVSPGCVANCARRLEAIKQGGRLVVDDRYQILLEYQNKTDNRKGKGPGDAFVKWALQNTANPLHVHQVQIQTHSERGFMHFPDDPDLATFDVADRKFVAVAAAHSERPPIVQAVDSKWIEWSTALKRHGITVEFLCPEDIARFRAAKAGP